ncbi:DUF2807 domain-containing protein [Halosquirtibacter laminarini]|uniref:DUF2807 domain-containing protein n=1 Tax=Halosquirtibacter laminarini TaxID=3374600 RepID=A0AC61NF98_9BACT|nr:DUF2807 domain-containing protein [Prolixibacteraceae bacterium]
MKKYLLIKSIMLLIILSFGGCKPKSNTKAQIEKEGLSETTTVEVKAAQNSSENAISNKPVSELSKEDEMYYNGEIEREDIHIQEDSLLIKYYHDYDKSIVDGTSTIDSTICLEQEFEHIDVDLPVRINVKVTFDPEGDYDVRQIYLKCEENLKDKIHCETKGNTLFITMKNIGHRLIVKSIPEIILMPFKFKSVTAHHHSDIKYTNKFEAPDLHFLLKDQSKIRYKSIYNQNVSVTMMGKSEMYCSAEYQLEYLSTKLFDQTQLDCSYMGTKRGNFNLYDHARIDGDSFRVHDLQGTLNDHSLLIFTRFKKLNLPNFSFNHIKEDSHYEDMDFNEAGGEVVIDSIEYKTCFTLEEQIPPTCADDLPTIKEATLFREVAQGEEGELHMSIKNAAKDSIHRMDTITTVFESISALQVNVPLEVILTTGESLNHIDVICDKDSGGEKIMNYTQDGDTLRLGVRYEDQKIQLSQPMKIHIYTQDLETLECLGFTSLKLHQQQKKEKMAISLHEHAKIEGYFNSDTLQLETHNHSVARVKGSIESLFHLRMTDFSTVMIQEKLYTSTIDAQLDKSSIFDGEQMSGNKIEGQCTDQSFIKIGKIEWNLFKLNSESSVYSYP